jgi:hypothetical protein
MINNKKFFDVIAFKYTFWDANSRKYMPQFCKIELQVHESKTSITY